MRNHLTLVTRTKYYFLETVIALAVLVLFNALVMPDRPAYEGIDPNPFWIVVLAIPIRYGRKGALFSGILSAAVFLNSYLAAGKFDAIYDDMWLLRFPFLFILVSFMLGEVKASFIIREDYLTERLREVENLNMKLQGESDIVKEAHKALTSVVAGRQDAVVALGEMTSRLKSDDLSTIFNAILQSFKEDLGAEECSFYEADEGQLKLVCSLGWQDYYHRPVSYPMGHGLIGLAGKMLSPFSIKDMVMKKGVAHESPPDMMGDSVFAIPVIGLNNKLYGVVSVEKIPFIKTTDLTLHIACIICDVAAMSLGNAFGIRQAKMHKAPDDQTGLFSYQSFLARLDEESLRSISYCLPLCVMAFHWPKIKSLDEAKRVPLLASVIAIINAKRRSFDMLAHGPNEDVPIVLLLVNTSLADAEHVKLDLMARLRDYGFDNELSDGPIEGTITIAACDSTCGIVGKKLLQKLGIGS